jgi:hypothetical protein
VGTVCAIVIVLFGSESEERLSQVAALEAGELSIVTNIGAKITPTSFMSPLFKPSEVQRSSNPRKGNTRTREGYYKRGIARTFGRKADSG